MKPIPQGSNIDFPKCPEGQHISRLVGIFDMGTQRMEFQGAVKYMPKVYLQFEVYAENEKGEPITDEEGNPFLVGQDFTASMARNSHLLPFVQGWRGKPLEEADFPFDFSRMLGQYGLMTISHTKSKDGTRTYAVINGLVPVPRPMARNAAGDSILPKGRMVPEFFDLDAEDWAKAYDIFERRLWDKMKEKVQSSPEFQERVGNGKPAVSASAGSPSDDDDIPF